MDRRIASPLLKDDASSRMLIDTLEKLSQELALDGAVTYYDFPMFRDDNNELLRSQTMFASKDTGIVFFRVASNEAELNIAIDQLDSLYALAFGRLMKNPRLRAGREKLVLSLTTCIYTDYVCDVQSGSASNIVRSDVELAALLRSMQVAPLSEDAWQELVATIEGSAALRRDREKGLATAAPDSRGAILGKILSRIASFDQDQRRAAITLVDGPQRIRGIAGSGKTIVLAMKAAHIHLVKPDAKVLITFWTKSLYDQFKYLVTRFYRQFSDADPDWAKIHILHAWGGRTTGGGVYYNACVASGVTPVTLADMKRLGAKPTFGGACEQLINAGVISQVYDYTLIDEGQDLPSSFYRLCFQVTKGGAKDRSVIWAYDELQTILDVSIQNVSDTFGTDVDGHPRMDLQRAEEQLSQGLQPHDIVLKRSYRNPAQVIVAAHALGFGIYSDKIVQILENARHWEDLGYTILEGDCMAGSPVRIRRPSEYSPINVSAYPGAGDVIVAQTFASYRQEIEWVAAEIKAFLSDGLRPQDLLVISLDDRNSKKYFADLSQILLSAEISVNNMSLPNFDVPSFFVEGSATLSTVYKAKGNEAAAVFVVGIDAVVYDTDAVRARNKIFAALTRSKAWLRVSGVAPLADGFVGEIKKSLENFPDLIFRYPDPTYVRTIQRDLAERSVKLGILQKAIDDLGLTNLTQEELMALLRGRLPKKH